MGCRGQVITPRGNSPTVLFEPFFISPSCLLARLLAGGRRCRRSRRAPAAPPAAPAPLPRGADRDMRPSAGKGVLAPAPRGDRGAATDAFAAATPGPDTARAGPAPRSAAQSGWGAQRPSPRGVPALPGSLFPGQNL